MDVEATLLGEYLLDLYEDFLSDPQPEVLEIIEMILQHVENQGEEEWEFDGVFDIQCLPQPCSHLFRFRETEVEVLASYFLPEIVHTQKRYAVPRIEAMCIVLRRLAYPNRWSDLVPLFKRKIPILSEVFNTCIDIIHSKTKHLCEFDFSRIGQAKLKMFAEVIKAKGAPYPRCFGFIDGTFRRNCRPIHHQRVVYSGHKRLHGLKFQGVSTPDGIIQEIYGPFPGIRHDSGILKESGLMEKLEECCFIDGEWYYLYGDPAYPIRPFLMPPFKGNHLTEAEERMNSLMSEVRQSVEWHFKDVIQYFAFLDFPKNLKIYLQPIAKYYQVAVVLMNCRTCFRKGNETSLFFQCSPPSLEEYLGI